MSGAFESALSVVLPSVDDVIRGLRKRYDPNFPKQAPAHVTVLYPFIEPAQIDDSALAAAREIVAATAPFDVTFAVVDEFPTVVWLRPEPEEPFRALTRALVEAYPQCVPYGGLVDPQPHCTVASEVSPVYQPLIRRDIADELVCALPLTVHVDAVECWTTDAHGIWSRHSDLPMCG